MDVVCPICKQLARVYISNVFADTTEGLNVKIKYRLNICCDKHGTFTGTIMSTIVSLPIVDIIDT